MEPPHKKAGWDLRHNLQTPSHGRLLNLIERYIFRRTLSLSMMSLFATTFIVLITQVLLFVNVLTQSGQALSAFLKLAFTLTPGMIMIVMPFALILGASNTLNRMNNDSELAVMEAAGAGRKFIIKPVLTLAMVLTLISLLIAQFAEPWANRHRRNLLVSAGADLIQIAIQSGTFRKLEKNLYVQIADQFPGGKLGGIFLVDRRDENTELLYYAKHGTMVKQDDQNLILMTDGEIHRRDNSSGDVSVISFASYALNLSQYKPVTNSSIYLPKEWTTEELLYPDPDNRIAQRSPSIVRSEIHRRFSEWMYPLVFALIAIYFAGTARANRQERIWSMGSAFGVSFMLRGLGFALVNKAGTSSIAAAACYALPLSAIVIFGFLLLTGSVIRVPQKLIEKTAALVSAFEAWRIGLIIRFSGYRKNTEGTL